MIADELATLIADHLRDQPNAMTMQLARSLNVPEAEVIRRLPGDKGVELDVTRWEEMIRALEPFGTVHVIVSNAATTLESTGTFGKFSTWGPFFNVQTKIDMHIRFEQLGSAFAVEKPGHLDGVPTCSLQFYDKAGTAAFKVFLNFGQAAVPDEKMAQFIAYRDQFRQI